MSEPMKSPEEIADTIIPKQLRDLDPRDLVTGDWDACYLKIINAIQAERKRAEEKDREIERLKAENEQYWALAKQHQEALESSQKALAEMKLYHHSAKEEITRLKAEKSALLKELEAKEQGRRISTLFGKPAEYWRSLEVEIERLKAENAELFKTPSAYVLIHMDDLKKLEAQVRIRDEALKGSDDATVRLHAKIDRLSASLAAAYAWIHKNGDYAFTKEILSDPTGKQAFEKWKKMEAVVEAVRNSSGCLRHFGLVAVADTLEALDEAKGEGK